MDHTSFSSSTTSPMNAGSSSTWSASSRSGRISSSGRTPRKRVSRGGSDEARSTYCEPTMRSGHCCSTVFSTRPPSPATVEPDCSGSSRRRGVSIALLGPDGAGKSTVAGELQETFYFPLRRVYMGLYQRAPSSPPRIRIPGLGLSRLLLRQWTRYAGARAQLERGQFVVFDRYTYDDLLPLNGSAGTLARVSSWILGHACPAPDLVVLLDAPAD